MNSRFKKRLFVAAQIAGGIAVLGSLGVAFLLFLNVERQSLYRNASPLDSNAHSGIQMGAVRPGDNSDSLAEIFPAPPSASDHSLAEVFSSDTLPRLLRSGLIVQLRHGESLSLLVVHAGRWRMQPETAKLDILQQLRAYNKVNGYPTPTQVRDRSTRQLLAEISNSASITVYL